MALTTPDVAFARFIAGIMMHVAMTNELKEGLTKIKFTLNHEWRFSHPYIAVYCGLLQTIMIVLVTMLNYLVIVLSPSTIDVAKDFLAMMIISDFDNYFFEEHHSHELSKSIILNKDDKYLDLFTVMRTTSIDCYRDEENENFNRFKPLKATKWLN